MNEQAIPYIIPLLIAGIVPLILIIYLLRRRKSLAAILFSALMFCSVFWSFSYSLELLTEGLSATLFFNKMKFLGIAPLPVFWILFALEYTGRKKWVTSRNMLLLFIVPIFNLTLVWTNFNNLFYEKLALNPIGGLAKVSIAGNGGPAFAFHSAYSYLLIILSTLLILYQVTKLHRNYLKEGIVLASGALIPLVGNAVYLSGLAPLPVDYDITTPLFLAPVIAFTWGILSFRLLEIVPVTRDAVFESIREAAFVVDRRNRIMDLNPAADRMVEDGYLSAPSGSFVGSQIDEMFPEEVDLSESEDNTPNEIELENQGGSRYFDVLITPLYDEREEFTGKVVLLRDISSRVASEKRQEFLHSLLRHDLRNKISVIEGYIDLLRDHDLSEDQTDIVERVAGASEDSMDLIEKVRTLRKINEEEEMKEVNIRSSIETVIEEKESRISEKGIDVSIEDCEKRVKGGPLLRELFSNLVENSIKHSGCGSIKISCEMKGEEYVARIEDDGKGIPDEDKEHIFEEGYKMGETAGSGLGTYIVKQIAESYGGGIEVKDSELGGARFDVHLQKA